MVAIYTVNQRIKSSTGKQKPHTTESSFFHYNKTTDADITYMTLLNIKMTWFLFGLAIGNLKMGNKEQIDDAPGP